MFFFLIIILFFFTIRNWGYVQACTSYVKVVVPFYTLKIPYRFIDKVRMTEFRKIFIYRDLSWADKRFLRPYFRDTVATLHLIKYPQSYTVLHFFLPRYLFIPSDTGFLFLIRDYVRFNTEVDSRLVVYREKAREKAKMKSVNILDEEYGRKG